MHPYTHETAHRITPDALRGWLSEATGCEVVSGFDRIERLGEARAHEGRVAGFMEVPHTTLREWVLGLSARRGLAWRSEPVPATNRDRVGFALSIGFGNGSPLPQPAGQFDFYVNGRLAVAARVANHSQLWRLGEGALAFRAHRIESAEPYHAITLSHLIRDEAFAAFGPALLTVPTAWVEPGQAAVIEVVPRCRVSSTRWFQLAESPGLLQHSDFYRVAELLGEGRVPERDGYRLYFGEIHAHSGQVGGDEEVGDFAGCGVGSRKEGYEYALGPGGVDFFAMTDHEHQIAPDPEDYFGLAEAYERPGRFAVLPAYEFTSVLYGHRNVYFGGPGGTLVPSGKDGTWITWEPKHAAAPAELWEGLEKNGVPFFTAVHHPSSASHPAAKTIFHPEHDRLVEIYSCWGSSEYYGDFPRGVADRYRQLYVRDMLAEGQRLGFIASSDGHDGCPGNNQSPGVKHHHIYHFCGSGRAVVLAEELRRDAVFEALRARRCYATTGVPIVLSFTVNGHRMGSEIAALSGAERPRLRIGVEGTNGLKEIRIVKNGRVVHTEWPHGLFAHDLEWEDAAYEAGTPACYYVRVVQKDYESAWSSPVWIG